MTQTLLVNRSDFADVALVNVAQHDLTEGHIRLSIGPWALTANNITYMAVGDMIGYWKFFEPNDYEIAIAPPENSHWGRMPVWGYAQVTESKCNDIPKGTLIYGFFPIAQSFDMEPTRITALGFQDGRDHRTRLHPVYNSYNFVDKDPSFAAHRDLQPILRPLFTTSFLIDDFLADESFFAAEQVLLLSASSKTAMGTAYCLKQRGNVKVSGLTSERNKDFTQGTGFYDEVYTYDTLTDMNPDVKTAIVDMAGNGDVTGNLYDHFEENVVYNCMVGKSHWNGAAPKTPKLGAAPVMFFAPDRVKQRMKDWGGQGFSNKLAERWLPFCEAAENWLKIEESHDVTALLKIYKNFLEGHTSPSKGYLFKI